MEKEARDKKREMGISMRRSVRWRGEMSKRRGVQRVPRSLSSPPPSSLLAPSRSLRPFGAASPPPLRPVPAASPVPRSPGALRRPSPRTPRGGESAGGSAERQPRTRPARRADRPAKTPGGGRTPHRPAGWRRPRRRGRPHHARPHAPPAPPLPRPWPPPSPVAALAPTAPPRVDGRSTKRGERPACPSPRRSLRDRGRDRARKHAPPRGTS